MGIGMVWWLVFSGYRSYIREHDLKGSLKCYKEKVNYMIKVCNDLYWWYVESLFNLTQPYKLTTLPWVFNALTFQFMLMQEIQTRASIMMITITMEISMTAMTTRLTGITTVTLAESRGEDLIYNYYVL